MDLFDSLSRLSGQPLQSKEIGVWGSDQAEVVSSGYTSQQDTEELFNPYFLPSETVSCA